MNNPEFYSKEEQEASEPDFYGKWLHVGAAPPQVDFAVIACCDDDVEQCTFREHEQHYWFELPCGKVFEATHWMPLPPPKTS